MIKRRGTPLLSIPGNRIANAFGAESGMGTDHKRFRCTPIHSSLEFVSLGRAMRPRKPVDGASVRIDFYDTGVDE